MNQLTPYAGANVPTLIEVMGTAIAKSQLLGCQNVDQGKVLAMTCIAKGVDPLTLASEYDIIQGKLSMRTDAMVARFHRLGGRHKIIQRDADRAAVLLTYQGSEHSFSLTWEEAQSEPWTKDRNGKIKTNYQTPRIRMQMLWARVMSDAIRAVAPEVNSGCYAPEELGDPSPGESSQEEDSDVIDAPFETAGSDKPCTDLQIENIRSLLREVAETEGNGDIADRVKQKLAESNLEKLSDLSEAEATQLIEALQRRNVSSFFAASLAGSAKND